ncbi:MAG: hypothetical protein ACE5EW_00595 [Thermoplasmata archaeon]
MSHRWSQALAWPATPKEIAGIAALSAAASVLELLNIDVAFPLLPVISFDPVGIPIAIAAILYGPAGALVAVSIMGFTIAARGNPIGATFKTTAELSTAVPLALALAAFRGTLAKRGAGIWILLTIAASVAIVSRVAVMTPFNYVFLQQLRLLPEALVLDLLLPIGIFNAVQGVINLVPAFLIVTALPPDLRPSWLTWGEG